MLLIFPDTSLPTTFTIVPKLIFCAAVEVAWAVAGSECNTVIELKREHHAASPRLLASLRPSPRSGI